MADETLKLHYIIPANDFTQAGEASSDTKRMLNQLGVTPSIVKKVAVAMYEAEMNAVIHANGGTADVKIDKEKVVISIKDIGSGIADLDLAMREGYSTATERIREMGFGAGMGLPNMKRYADNLEIDTKVGEGTKVVITVFLEG